MTENAKITAKKHDKGIIKKKERNETIIKKTYNL